MWNSWFMLDIIYIFAYYICLMKKVRYTPVGDSGFGRLTVWKIYDVVEYFTYDNFILDKVFIIDDRGELNDFYVNFDRHQKQFQDVTIECRNEAIDEILK